jgi:ubiquinone/menaquinone biosynthesis C-methylase UbiE
MTSTLPSDRSSDIATYYDDYSTWYEGERREGYYGLINDLEVQAIAPFARGRDVLEIGCGTGLILEHTAAIADSAIGVDLSVGMAGVSQRKGLVVSVASATDLPFGGDSFDLVYSCKVLPHVPDIRTALAEVARVLRADGTAFVEFYNRWSLKALSYRLVTMRRAREPVYVRHDDIDSIRSYLPPGWAIDAVRGIRVIAPVRHVYGIPLVGRVVQRLERRLCDTWLGRRFGGYLLVRISRHA